MHPKSKITQKMETEFVYSKMDGMSVEMQTQEEKNMTLLRGKALLNEDESRLTFVQNAPRGARSVEVGRSGHSRMVRRPDGLYTLTFRFNASEKYLKESLISEIREVVKLAESDMLVQKAIERAEKKKEAKKGGVE